MNETHAGSGHSSTRKVIWSRPVGWDRKQIIATLALEMKSLAEDRAMNHRFSSFKW
jgi:hypothetical protein